MTTHLVTLITRDIGMTTARWMALPLEPLPVGDLEATQLIDPDLWPVRRPDARACADYAVHVVEVAGARYLEDGHHRWARARARHEGVILGRCLVVTVAAGLMVPVPRAATAPVLLP